MSFRYFYNAHDVENNVYPMAHDFQHVRSVTPGDTIDWCIKEFGPPEKVTYLSGHRCDGRWQFSLGGRFLFRDADDAFMFRMRWS